MTQKKIDQYYSDDYAGLTANDIKFYYGYEVEDPITKEWCFEVKKCGIVIFRATKTEIEHHTNKRQLDGVKNYLLAGIGMWLYHNNLNITK